MAKRNAATRSELKCINDYIAKFILGEVMDITSLSYPGELFDLIIDKSTIDALLCGDSAYMNVAKMLKVF
jgi:hypothetical protein